MPPTDGAPCRSCGACCAFSREWPRFTLEDDAELARIPSRFVDERPGEPFHVMAWTSATHHPYEPGPRIEIEDFFAGREEPFDAWNMNRYLNLLKEADRQLGRLFAGLRERGLDGETLVVVTGDHGEAFGEPHGAWGHGSRLYEESVRVPLMIWNPKLVRAGRRG